MVNTLPDIHSAEKFDKEAEAALLADLREQETSSEEASQVTPPPIVVPTTLDPSVVPPPETTPPPVVTEPLSYSEQIKEKVRAGASATEISGILNRTPPTVQNIGRISGLPNDIGTFLDSSQLSIKESFEKALNRRFRVIVINNPGILEEDSTDERGNFKKGLVSLALEKYDGAYKGAPEDLEERRNIYIAKVLKLTHIPYYPSEEEAYDDGALRSNGLFAVKAIGSAKYPTIRKRDVREEETTWDAVLQVHKRIEDSAGDLKTEALREGFSYIQAAGRGAFEIASYLPEIFKYTALYGPSAEWGPIIAGKLWESEEYYQRALEQGSQEVERRKNLLGLGKAVDWWDNWKRDMEEAYMEHPVWKGVDYKKRTSGRIAKLFAEESIESRILAINKFARGLNMFKNFGKVDLDNPEAIAEKLGISVTKAARRLEKHKLGLDKGLQHAYLMSEAEAGLNFAIAFGKLEQVDSQGNPVPTLSGMGVAFGGGLLAAITTPTRGIGKLLRTRYHLADWYYGVGDSFRTKALTPQQKYRRQRIYLQHKGLSGHQIDRIYKEKGSLDSATNGYLLQQEHGNLSKLMVHINNMEPKEREAFVKMADASFNALSSVKKAGEAAGVDTEIFIDYILNLSKLQQLKEQIFATKHGLFSHMWTKVMKKEYDKIKQNEVKIQKTLVLMLDKLKTHVDNSSGLEYEDAVQKHLADFVGWADSVTKKSEAEIGSAFNQERIRHDLELSDLNQVSNNAKFQTVNSIAPTEVSEFRRDVNVRADNTERLLVGRKGGRQIVETKNGEEVPVEGIFQKMKNEADDQWNQIDFSQRIDSREFFRNWFDKYSNDPNMTEAFNDIITKGMSSSQTRRIIGVLSEGNLERLTVEDLPELKRIYKEKMVGDDAKKLANFEENYGWPFSAEEQLDKLKVTLRQAPLLDKIEIIPSSMSLQEIKRFNTYLNEGARAHSTDQVGHVYREIRESLNTMLETAEKDLKAKGMSSENIQRYRNARIGWREHARMWKNGGPMEKILSRESSGSSIFKDAFLKDADFINDNSELFFTLRKGIPIGVADDGTILYKKHDPEDLKMIDDGLRYAIAEGIHNGSTDSLDHLIKIRASYGSFKGDGSKFLSKIDEQKLDNLIDIRSEALKPIREQTIVKLNNLKRQTEALEKVETGAIDRGFLSQLSVQARDGDTTTVTNWLTTRQQIVYRDELTNEQIERFDDLLKSKYAGKTINSNELVVTPLEYLKLKTNNFTTKGGPEIKENLNALLLDQIIKEVLVKTNSKEVTEDILGVGKLAMAENVNPIKLDELIQRIGKVRAEILGDDANTLIDQIHQGAIARLDLAGEVTESLGTSITKGVTDAGLLSRAFALQRGVIGLRYIIGEASFRELRKGQVSEIRKLLSDPDASTGLLAMMKDPELLAEGRTILGVKSLHWGSAIRALAYVTGLKFGDATRLFTEEEAQAAFRTGYPPESVVNKALAFRDLKESTKGHFGSGTLFKQKLGVPTTESEKEKYKEQQTAKLRDEMNSLGLS